MSPESTTQIQSSYMFWFKYLHDDCYKHTCWTSESIKNMSRVSYPSPDWAEYPILALIKPSILS